MELAYTILVADDDADDRQTISYALGTLPFRFNIIQLENGKEVLDYLLRRERFQSVTGPPDLILLDLNMPLLDGFEVMKGIRLQQLLSTIPVHVITVSRDPEHEKKARSLGATGFYHKGNSARELSETVQKIIHERRGLSGLGLMF